MRHEERARKIANLINSQKFSGLLEDLLDAQFAEVDETARRLGQDAGWETAWETATNALKTEQSRLTARIALIEAERDDAERRYQDALIVKQPGMDMIIQAGERLRARIALLESERARCAVIAKTAVEAIGRADALVRCCQAANSWCSGCHSGCEGCDLLKDYQAARAKVTP